VVGIQEDCGATGTRGPGREHRGVTECGGLTNGRAGDLDRIEHTEVVKECFDRVGACRNVGGVEAIPGHRWDAHEGPEIGDGTRESALHGLSQRIGWGNWLGIVRRWQLKFGHGGNLKSTPTQGRTVAKTTSTTEVTPDNELERASSKGRPTPTRREREAERKRPLVSNDRAEARRQARAAGQVQRERARIGMANGEERYLPVRDRGPQKKFVRDYIDARFSVGEALIPLMLGVIVLTFFPQLIVQTIGLIALWVFFAIAVIDCFVVGLIVRKKLAAKFGDTRVESGVRWYAAMRALQLRVMRMPKAQVARGAYPE
jgi:hypothetical protein